MKRVQGSVLLAAAGLLALTGCDTAREMVGLQRQSIDEFVVAPQAPLTLPPDFSLRPPRPGASRPQNEPVTDSARRLLFGEPVSGTQNAPASGSAVEQAFLRNAGATDPEPDIRARIDRESAVLSNVDETFVERLMVWRSKPEPGTIVDPAKEAERLKGNAAAGKPATEGDTPIIERDPRGWR